MRVLLALLFVSTVHAADIRAFGAHCDVVTDSNGKIVSGTDDGPALQAAINAWAMAGGDGEITFSGRCLFRSGALWYGGADRLRLSGIGARLYVSGPALDTWLDFISVRSLVFADLTIIGDNDQTVLDFHSNLIRTAGSNVIYERNSFWGLEGWNASTRAAYIVNSNDYSLTMRDNNFFGCATPDVGAVIVAAAGDIQGIRVQDYEYLDGGVFYSKTPQGAFAWILFYENYGWGADSRRNIRVVNGRFDEGAQASIYLMEPSDPTHRYHHVYIADSTFLPAISGSGRAVNAKNADTVTVERISVEARSATQPQLSFLGVGDVVLNSVRFTHCDSGIGCDSNPKATLASYSYCNSLTIRDTNYDQIGPNVCTQTIVEQGGARSLPDRGALIASQAVPWALYIDRAHGGVFYSDGSQWLSLSIVQ